MEYKINIIDKANQNSFFRQVLLTTKNSQVVVMSIKPGEDIGLESHKVDQVLVFTSGVGIAKIGGKEYKISQGDLFQVPAGTEHNFINSGQTDLKLFTIYAPSQHEPDTVHKTKADAEQEENY